ncbi:Wzz/FepE/Etk N-terminal domain-containing protein [Amycolatopsis sp. FDAARGOS 1241]|uniref:Wzz/FepE/Etk N-terminal domain-containing protein n=1 Tax=Amycolatopsis sp. FDAARGOS 1241 TaxID=2778070 RepID=UPI00194E1AF5|nr:Wzz/FepE/Etk N-terminal domain-containing protein [Amycolatopsis sp. FDAARGOS 1241]QRP45457.1 exopolysaccharide biosynthesis protein [Amycolatopsis sp. FDAARGOS 1241]
MTTDRFSSPPLIDLQRLVVAVRRHRRLWLAFALLGLVVGGAVAVLLPAPPTAVTKVIVIHPDDSPTDSGTLMRTDVAVLQTAKIASAALKKAGSTESTEDFLKDYAGLGLTNNVMQVTVKAKSQTDALAKAQALADVFIADHVQRNQAAATAQAKALLDQRTQAQQQLTQVDSQAAAEADKGSRANAGTLEQLYSQRADLVSKIADLQNQAQQAGIGTPQVAAGTQIVDAPAIVKVSFLKTVATNGAIGLALGLALGLGLAMVTALVRDRPVLRRELSAHLGASVIAQLRSKPRGPARLWARSRPVIDRKRVAVTLVRAARSERGPLSLLELGAPGVAAGLALDIAKELAEDGPVVVVDDLPHRDAAKQPAMGDVTVVEAGDPAAKRATHLIGVGTVAPGTAWTDLAYLGRETVLVVRSGYANTLWLHTVARQLADCGIPVLGVVLVDPDPKDHTDGTLWDGLHTALRGRASVVAAKQAAQPAAQPALQPAARIADEKPAGATNDKVPERPQKFVAQEPEKPIDWPVEQDNEKTIESSVVRPVNAVEPKRNHHEAPTRRLSPVPRKPEDRTPTPEPRKPDQRRPDQSADSELPTRNFAPVQSGPES